MFWTHMVVIVSRLGISPDVPADLELVHEAKLKIDSSVVDRESAAESRAEPETTEQVEGDPATARGLSATLLPAELVDAVRGVLFVGHLQAVADVPSEYGWYVYRAAAEHGLDAKDLAAVLVSEGSGPVMDFSFEGAAQRRYDLDYEPDAEGQAGERGLFQVHPSWAPRAGFEVDDLFDPAKAARIAAYVVRMAQERHAAECETRRYNYHTWIAHYKCAPEERDELDGLCRFKQKKWEKLRASLDTVASPDFKAIGRAHDRWVRKVQHRALRDWKRQQRRRAHQTTGVAADG